MTTVRRAPAGTWVRWSLSVASFFVAWELLGRTRRFFAISPFSEVLPKLLEALRSKELWSATAGTLWIALVGFLIAAVVGISLGTLTGASRLAADVLDPFINAAYGTPMSMLIPVLGIYVGLDMRGKVFLVFMLTVFVVTMNTAEGIRSSSHELREMGQSFGMPTVALYTKIILPNASPNIVTGLRLGAGRAVQAAILADLLLRSDNLGLYLIRAGSSFDIPLLLAATFFVTMLAAALMIVGRMIEARLLRWKRL